MQFYLGHYFIGQQGKPGQNIDPKNEPWLFHPVLRDIISAVGVAGMSNLTGDTEMSDWSRKKYVSVIRQTGKLIMSTSTAEAENTLRIVVLLALFEVQFGI